MLVVTIQLAKVGAFFFETQCSFKLVCLFPWMSNQLHFLANISVVYEELAEFSSS